MLAAWIFYGIAELFLRAPNRVAIISAMTFALISIGVSIAALIVALYNEDYTIDIEAAINVFKTVVFYAWFLAELYQIIFSKNLRLIRDALKIVKELDAEDPERSEDSELA